MPKAFLRCSVGSNEDGTGCFPFSPSFLGFQNGLLMTVNFQGVFIKDCVVRVGEHKPKLSCDGHALCMALQPPRVSSHCCSVNVSFEAAPPQSQKLKGETTSSATLTFFFTWRSDLSLYSIQYAGLMSTFIVFKCHIYLDQLKEDCVENKTDTYFQKEFPSPSRTLCAFSSHQEMGITWHFCLYFRKCFCAFVLEGR